MMLRLAEVMERAIAPAMAILPKHLDSDRARLMLLAIGLQESRFEHRDQIDAAGAIGPALGLWQFEKGGGVAGVFRHSASHLMLRDLCHARDVSFDVAPMWHALASDDVFAAGVARLLLWTDAKPLPLLGERDAAWEYYLRLWRPGKPKRRSWRSYYDRAMEEIAPRRRA
jgi:hypothetical protein